MVERESLTILGAKVKVKLMGPLDKDRFLLSEVPPSSTRDDIKEFFSTANIDSKIQQVIFGQQFGVVMLQFTFPPPGDYTATARG